MSRTIAAHGILEIRALAHVLKPCTRGVTQSLSRSAEGAHEWTTSARLDIRKEPDRILRPGV
ncbi:hypothetical protein BTJ49_14625 [Oleiagrimonas sp. MCCC 1A03011]|nr:hypothetical protein BTJ49_14625 [Oleiagrimonas sp. MCCC 1A03011]